MKIGDKVRLLKNSYYGDSFARGNIGYIVEVYNPGSTVNVIVYEVNIKCLGEDNPKIINGASWPFYANEIEVISDGS